MDLKQILKQRSIDYVKDKSALDEYHVPVTIIIVLSIITSIISIYAGFAFMRNFAKIFAEGVQGWILALIIATLIEALTILFVTYLVKSTIKRELINIVFWTIFAGAAYSMHFYTSTTGLQLRAEAKTDKTVDITSTYSADSVRIAKQYGTAIDSLLHANGILAQKNTEYNFSQVKYNQRLIDRYSNKQESELTKLAQSKAELMAVNTVKVTESGENNYNYIVVNQIIQLITHLLIGIFFYTVGRANLAIEERIKHDVAPQMHQLKVEMVDEIVKDVTGTYRSIAKQMVTPRNNDDTNTRLNSNLAENNTSRPTAAAAPTEPERKRTVLVRKSVGNNGTPPQTPGSTNGSGSGNKNNETETPKRS